MTLQRWAFLDGEGDEWYRRNADAPVNPVVIAAPLWLDLPANPTIVELGCSDGRYISIWHKHFRGTSYGIDPSEEALAIAKERHPNVTFIRNTSHAVKNYRCDLIVFGFCLYLEDRDHLLDLVADTNIALKDGGYIAIHDFDPPSPKVVPYHHKEGLFSYKMDYSKLWLANPAYELVSKTTTRDGEAITIIRKGTWDKWR